MREIIYLHSDTVERLDGEVEVDESYFSGARKGNRGRGAAGKVPVFGLLKCNGKVFTVMMPDAKTKTLMPIIRCKVKPDSIVYSDCWRAYNALDVSEFKHYRINHSKLFANKHNHINGIEDFWNQAKRHLRKFNGIPREHFHFFLNEGTRNMSLYKGMNAETLEAEYNLTKRRGADPTLEDFPLIVERCLERSAKYREASGAQIDIAYGEGEREKLDYFYSGDPNGPMLLYIHGGYWQRGDKSMYSFVSESFLKHGVSVAVINYKLTPSVRIGQIPPQIRKAIAWCYHNASDLKFDRDQIHVSGHSAGGHLTAMMMATDWPMFDNRLPVDLVKTGILISGIFELEPIVHTSLNEGPQMDIEEAVAESPIFIPPVTNASQLVVYGGGESAEFHRQSIDYADKFRTNERSMEVYEVPICDHFEELERLAEDDSVFFEKVHKLITT